MSSKEERKSVWFEGGEAFELVERISRRLCKANPKEIQKKNAKKSQKKQERKAQKRKVGKRKKKVKKETAESVFQKESVDRKMNSKQS